MTKIPPPCAYLVRVIEIIDLSPNLRRLVLYSPELAQYPHQYNGAHLKIFLAPSGQNKPQLPQFLNHGFSWEDPDNKPIVRTYTLRDYDAQQCTVTIDFVKHGDNGPASAFAEQAQLNDLLGISSPGGPFPMVKSALRYLFVADITALPALEALLADMDQTAKGDVIVLLPQAEDLPATLQLPAGMNLHEFYGNLMQIPAVLNCVSNLAPMIEDDFAWIAGEASLVMPIRAQLRDKWHLPPKRHYAVPYWHDGRTEENYHTARHKFIDE